jgi:hypothetical protein
MRTNDLRRIPLGRLSAEPTPTAADWLWHGYLRAGEITLLTSQWKTGKTTLLLGLLRALGAGHPFLDRPTRPSRAWVISEEPQELWRDRVQHHPVGGHVELMPRPFRGRPTRDEWGDLIDTAVIDRPDLFVVDTLAHFLPGRSESDASTLHDSLQPLHRLTTSGAAVLLLHHPRKKPSEAGSSARGSGALLAFADVLMELSRYGKLKSDARRRLLFARSRRPETPERLAYEWESTCGEFRTVNDPRDRQYAENWATVEQVLRDRGGSMTCADVAANWPDEWAPPGATALYSWLHAAHARKLLARTGRGTRTDPYRFRLRTKQDDENDRFRASLPELPPLDYPSWD